MVTRRTDARRRRVLSEEFVPTDQNAVDDLKRPMQAYSYGANRRNQPKTTDMIPKRAVSLGLFFLLIAGVVAGLNALARYATPLAEIVGEAGSRCFALSGSGTLANWCSCLSLFLCGAICVQLFFLRKHKRDDYGGMYHVWLLMAVVFFVASIDCAIDLRTMTAKIFESLTHRSLLQTPWLMMIIELIVLAVIVIRMLFEVRASRFSLAAVLLVWLGFVGCIVLENTRVPATMPWLDPNMAYGNCVLLGCLGALVTLVVYTRFVFLRAHGLIQVKIKAREEIEVTEPRIAPTTRKSTARSSTKTATQSRKQTVAETVEESESEKKTSRSRPKPVVVTSETSSSSKKKKAKTTTSTATEAAPAKPRKHIPLIRPGAPSLATTAAKPPSRTVTQGQTAEETPAQDSARAESPAKTESPAPARKSKRKQQTLKPTAKASKPTTQTTAEPAQKQQTLKPPAQAPQKKVQSDELQQELEDIEAESGSMSKSERRRLRKLAKRAAKAKKAA